MRDPSSPGMVAATKGLVTTSRMDRPPVTAVAILMATFNGARWIREQLDSILGQEGVSVSILVSDDGSTDGTLEIVRDVAAKHGRVTILGSVPGLGSPIRNFFRLIRDVDFSGFEYVFFADQDDVWGTDKAFRAISQMELAGADCYASDLTAWFPDGKTVVIRKSFPQKSLDYLFQSASAGCTYAMSRKAVEVLKNSVSARLLELPRDASHDWLTYAITRSRGLIWVIDPVSRIKYRQHDTNAYGGAGGIAGILKQARLLRRGWYRNNIALAARNSQLDERGRLIIAALTRFGFADRIFLVRNVRHFRRRSIECFGLAILIVVGII